MKILLDTDTCIYAINNKQPGILARVREYRIGEVGTSSITYAELRFGVENSGRVEENTDRLERFLLPLEIVPFTVDPFMRTPEEVLDALFQDAAVGAPPPSRPRPCFKYVRAALQREILDKLVYIPEPVGILDNEKAVVNCRWLSRYSTIYRIRNPDRLARIRMLGLAPGVSSEFHTAPKRIVFQATVPILPAVGCFQVLRRATSGMIVGTTCRPCFR